MIDLNEMQKEIFENKVRKGFNTTDVSKEIILLMEELGELAEAYRDKNDDGIRDMIIYLLGLCQMKGIDSEELIKEIVEKNKSRTHRSHME